MAFSVKKIYGNDDPTPGDNGNFNETTYVDGINITIYYTTDQEATAPVIASHPDVTAIATNVSGANVTYTTPNATDDIDGVTTANCLPISGSLFTIGATSVTCTKTNTAGKSATPTHFNVIVTDGTIPTITLNGNNPEIITVGGNYIDAGATANDGYDGDISKLIVKVDNVNTSTVGSYTVTYNVSDAAGNAASTITRTVTVAPRKITVVANNLTKVSGTADPTLTYSITSGSLVSSDGFTGTLTRIMGETAGTYAINRGSLKLSDNYTLNFTDGLFEITPAPIVASVASANPANSGNPDPAPTSEVATSTVSETPVATAILGTQTNNNAKATVDKKIDTKKSTGIFDLTLLGIHDWLWFILISAATALWWIIVVGRRRKDEQNEQN